MKPTFQTGRPVRTGELRPGGHYISNSPVTDWSYQAGHRGIGGDGGSASFHHDGSGFRHLSQDYFEDENKRDYRLEAGAFVIIVALAVWPMVITAQAVVDLLK